MSKEVNIYVEGKGDLVFLCHFMKKRFGFELIIKDELNAISEGIENLKITVSVFDPESGHGGIDSKKIKSLIEEIKSTKAPLGIDSIVLLDSDTPLHVNPRGGYSNRKKYLEALNNTTPFNFFLIPNNKDNGNLEDLLDKIIGEKGKPFFSCLQGYITCLKTLSGENIPKGVSEISDFKKTQMEWYTYMMLGKRNKNTGADRDYSNGIWDLESNSLDPLYDFLKKNLKNE